MKMIGLTGGIASGKSTVSRMLAELGASIIDADQLAREVVAPGLPAWQEIVSWLGEEILLADGAINRRILGERVFSDLLQRRRLEQIIHPRIREKLERTLAAVAEQGAQVVVLDVPLLLESNWNEMVDDVWVVYVKPEVQLQRLMNRDGLTKEAALQRISSQMSLDEKVRRAQVVIDNSDDLEQTRAQVLAAWRKCQI